MRRITTEKVLYAIFCMPFAFLFAGIGWLLGTFSGGTSSRRKKYLRDEMERMYEINQITATRYTGNHKYMNDLRSLHNEILNRFGSQVLLDHLKSMETTNPRIKYKAPFFDGPNLKGGVPKFGIAGYNEKGIMNYAAIQPAAFDGPRIPLGFIDEASQWPTKQLSIEEIAKVIREFEKGPNVLFTIDYPATDPFTGGPIGGTMGIVHDKWPDL